MSGLLTVPPDASRLSGPDGQLDVPQVAGWRWRAPETVTLSSSRFVDEDGQVMDSSLSATSVSLVGDASKPLDEHLHQYPRSVSHPEVKSFPWPHPGK